MRRALFIVMLLLMAASVFGIESGSKYDIATVTCFGTIEVNVLAQTALVEGEVFINNCKKQDALGENWICSCDAGSNTTISTTTKKDATNIYDFTIQYYTQDISGINDTIQQLNYLRTKRFTNIEFSPGSAKPKEKVKKYSTENTPVALGVLGLVILVFMMFVVLGVRFAIQGSEGDVKDEFTRRSKSLVVDVPKGDSEEEEFLKRI